MTSTLSTVADAKSRARALRATMQAQGIALSHSQALEQVARDQGFRDWNTLSATLETQPSVRLTPGGRVTGRYLSQPFVATILAVEALHPGWIRVTLNLDQAVDVVTFDSFSSFRKRITGEIGPKGHSREKTSNGRFQLVLDI